MAKKSIDNVKMREPGELLIHEESSVYCRKSVKITNALGAAVLPGADMLGAAVVDNDDGTASLVANAAVATTNALILDGDVQLHSADPTTPGDPLASGATTLYNYSILRKGPAVINKNRVPDTDLAGNAITQASIISAMEDEGVKAIDVSPEVSEQTT